MGVMISPVVRIRDLVHRKCSNMLGQRKPSSRSCGVQLLENNSWRLTTPSVLSLKKVCCESQFTYLERRTPYRILIKVEK